MEKLKQALAELGYSKSVITLIIETMKCVEHSPDIYIAANEIVKELQKTAIDLGNANTVLKQISSITAIGPAVTRKEKNSGGIPREKKTEKAAPKKPGEEIQSGPGMEVNADYREEKEAPPLRKETKSSSPKIEL